MGEEVERDKLGDEPACHPNQRPIDPEGLQRGPEGGVRRLECLQRLAPTHHWRESVLDNDEDTLAEKEAVAAGHVEDSQCAQRVIEAGQGPDTDKDESWRGNQRSLVALLGA